MGELRERMHQALMLHGMAPRTQEAYLTAVQGIAKYYHQRPDTFSEAQLQAYSRSLLDERHLSADGQGLQCPGNGGDGGNRIRKTRKSQQRQR